MEDKKRKDFESPNLDYGKLDTRKTDKRSKLQDEKEEVPEKEVKPVAFYRLFRFLSREDKVWLALGVLSAFIASSCFAVLNVLFGEMAELMVNSDREPLNCSNSSAVHSSTFSPEIDQEELVDQMTKFSIYMTIVGVIQLFTGYLFISIFCRLAEIQIYRLRQEYLKALLRQDIGWYDVVQDRNFVSKISENVTKVQEAIAEKAAMCVFDLFSTFFCLALALWQGWLLTLVVLSTAPVIAIATVIVSSLQSKLTIQEQKSYSKAGMVAQEALSNIKTVMAFGGQHIEMERFKSRLVFALRAGRKRGIVSALGNGFLWFLNYSSYSLVFWYGTKLIFDGRREACTKPPEYETGAFMSIFFNVLTASYRFGQALSYMEVFAIGRGAAASIYSVIDRDPEIDSYAKTGNSPNRRVKGKIEFKNVRFAYPSRKDTKVLNGINLDLEPGTTVALVGSSGCGKSTCLQLLQRFYDPDDGSISVDGVNIKELNLNWHRSQLGVVSQEPVLFNTTIAENVRYGKEGATQLEIEEACKLANAHTFISRLPQKYGTVVGERGAQLSGGQKQRIAIARALIRNPSILLLDEATSALDTQSEAVVQEALDRASAGRTTIIVAHRLSTIRNADVIVSLKDGQVAEIGSHDRLMEQNGLYHQLVTSQTSGEIYDFGNTGNKLSDRKMSLEPPEDQKLMGCLALPLAEEELDKRLAKRTSFFSLLRLNSKEWHWMALGFFFSILQGGMLPLYAYFYGEFMGVLSMSDAEEAQKEANVYALYFLGIGVYAGITIGVGLSCFSIAGEALTNRLRKLSFETMLKQDLAWYDSPKQSVGGLCTRLSGDAASVQGATGTRLGIVAQAFTTIMISAGLGFYALPKLGAVAVAFVPFIVVAGFYSGKMMENQQIEEKFATESASSYAFQAVSSIRTVASLGKERTFLEMYSQSLLQPHKKAVAHSHLIGFVFGFSQGLLYFAYAAVFYYGAYLISEEDVEYTKVFIIGEALIWSMLLVGQTLAFAPNYNKAKVAGGRILNLLDTKPSIHRTPGTGLQIRNSEGSVIFDKVEFSYPERKEMKVLKGLTLGIEPNKHIGICGPSGSGKSTCIQLMLRYYDPTSGRVLFDETDVSTLNLDTYRSQLAIVAQEPALFDRSLAENIAYGDNTRNVGMDEIMDAARAANIHSFITSLPSGYSTRVGEMGTQLSGGQKQRVAIARALVRKPKLLLLDEATSALDAESEKVVQAALDNASVGRTCITIAHRLSSIQTADKILVIAEGKLSESGTHEELLKEKGLYHKLWSMQKYGLSLN